MIWFVLLAALSHKTKIIGERAIRPLYIGGVVFGLLSLTCLWWRHVRVCGLRWRGVGPLFLVGVLFIVTSYILLQATFLFPGSFRSSVYITSTVVVVFALTLTGIRAVGWEQTLADVLAALMAYTFVNVVATIVAVRYPHLLTEPGLVVSSGGYVARPVGIVGDPTQLGALYAVTLLLMFLLKDRFKKVWLIPVASLLFVALVLTGSRNAILSLIAACVVALVARDFASALLKVLGAGYLAVMLGTSLLMAPGVIEGLSESAELSERFRVGDPNAFSRLRVWQESARIAGQMTLPQQVFGGGLKYIYGELNGSPYNAFLRLFFSLGLAGVFAVVLAILVAVVCALSDPVTPRRQAVLALLTFTISFSMFLDTLFARFFHFGELPFWLAIAVVATKSPSLLERAPRRAQHE